MTSGYKRARLARATSRWFLRGGLVGEADICGSSSEIWIELMMAQILSFRDWESSAVGSSTVLGETRAISCSTHFSALQQMRKKFFEGVCGVLRDPRGHVRRSVVDPFLIHLGHVMQPRENSGLIVRDFQLEHFTAGELALTNDFDQPVDAAAGQR